MRLLARLLAGLALIVSTVAGALVLSAGPAAASCAEPSIDFLDGNDVAFSGVVTKRSLSGDDVITTVRADRVFKGAVTRKVDVVSVGDGGYDPLDARTGARLIVFGQLVDGEVTSNFCLAVTAPGKYYRQLSADLGEGSAPTPGYMQAERRTLGLSYDQFSAGRAILGVLGLVGLGYFAFRAWRARRPPRD